MASDHRYREGPDAAQRFERALSRLVSVSKEELARRETTPQKARLAKRNRPKPPK